MIDPIGEAISDYFENGEAENILIHTNYTEGELLAPAFFFRNEYEMPLIEKTALSLCRGKILDIGAAAGCHTLTLQNRGFSVTALEKSKLSAEVMIKRGILNVVCTNLFDYKTKGFDTILVLMNGTGIGETLKGLKKMLKHLKSLLSKNGQILIDSSDLRYLFEEEDGSLWVDLTRDKYAGEMEYELVYKNWHSKFQWLFVDFETLTSVAAEAGLNCEMVEEGNHYDFLVKLS
jgi:hypothetical protein